MNPASTEERCVGKRGVVESWESRSSRLFEQLRRPAAAMLRRAFGSAFAADEIDDIYSSAWVGTLRALSRRHDDLDDEEIRKYLLTAVAHQASKELRRRRRRPTSPIDEAPEVLDPIAPAPDDQAVASEDRSIARELLVTLPPRRRAVMMLRYGWGLEPRQVCGLVKGLSPRAYRKEITRGINDLTRRMRMVEEGEWCADREPLLKAYASGLASDEQNRQARHHLANCRSCSEFVGRLTGHLHDMGSGVLLPLALGGVDAHERIPVLFDQVGLLGQGDGAEGMVTAAAQSGAARSSGSVGVGLLAKVAGLGVGGKLGAACLAGGAAALTCAAVGIGPVVLPDAATGKGPPSRPTSHEKHVPAPPEAVTLVRPDRRPPAQLAATSSVPVASEDEPAQPPQTARQTTPVVATATPAESEFGTAAVAAPAATAPTAGHSGGSPESSAVGSEFGP